MFIIKTDFKSIRFQNKYVANLIRLKKNKRERNYKHLLGCNELSYQEI